MTDDSAKPRGPGPERGAAGPQLTPRVALRYFLIQLPGWALVAWIALTLREPFDIEVWLAWTIVAIWTGKDVLLFPFLWRFYQLNPHSETHSLVGVHGVAQERLAPSGYVRVRNELWRAEAADPDHTIRCGTPIRVTGTRGLTLLVTPADDKQQH